MPISKSAGEPPSSAIAAVQRATKIAVVMASFGQENLACAGGGVSSSINAGARPFPEALWPPLPLNLAGASLPPMVPRMAAASTIHGKSSLRKKMPTKASTAMMASTSFLIALAPMRQAANSTTATTAGLMP